MAADLSTASPQDDTTRPRRHFLDVALCVAALANTLIPAVFFADTRLFGHTEPRYRILVAAAVVAEYAIAFLLLVLHTNAAFASGYAVATASVVTLGSAALAFLTVYFSGAGWSELQQDIIVLSGFAFAVVANAVFLVAGIRYARAIHPRLHLGGFLLGVAACLVVIALYLRLFR